MKAGHDFIKACSDEISTTVNLVIGKYAIQYKIDMDYLTQHYQQTVAMILALYMAEHYGANSKVMLDNFFDEVSRYSADFKPDFNTAPQVADVKNQE